MGAKAMVQDGLYSKHGVPKPDYLVGLHTASFPTGTVTFRPGGAMAGTDQLHVTFHGTGGHGSIAQIHERVDPQMPACLDE